MTAVLACPHCGDALERTDSGAACAAGHSFDRAREGYLNLLPGGRLPASTVAGDTADALAARRRFLSTGAYAPVADAVASALGDVDGALLDIGCGEGWYLARMVAPSRFGIDISKKAVQMAARSLPDADFAVASSRRMPVLDGSCAAVMSVFAPHPFDEIARVLRPGGTWVTATPGPMHLHEMRPAHLPGSSAEERFARRAEPPEGAGDAVRVTFTLALTAQSAADLHGMTPLQWQSGSTASAVDSVTVDVWVARGTRDSIDRPAG